MHGQSENSNANRYDFDDYDLKAIGIFGWLFNSKLSCSHSLPFMTQAIAGAILAKLKPTMTSLVPSVFSTTVVGAIALPVIDMTVCMASWLSSILIAW